MQKDVPKIIFFGNTNFSSFVLGKLSHFFKILAVVTNEPKPMGRGRKNSITPVHDFSEKKNIPLININDLNDKFFLASLENLKADFFIVVAYRILPISILKLPKIGSINLHTSLLPKYRGAAPIQRALLNGDKETGVSTFIIDKKVDTGKIILQKRIKINDSDNFEDLEMKMMQEGSSLLRNSIDLIYENRAQLIVQDEALATKAPKITKEEIQINWNESVELIQNKIRAFSPSPGAYTFLKKKRIKIFASSFKLINHNYPISSVISTKDQLIHVACKDGILMINNLQLEGKKIMSSEEFLRGNNIMGENFSYE